MKLRNILFAAAAIVLTASCENSTYDSGYDGGIIGDFIEAHTNRDSIFDYAFTDQGDTLIMNAGYRVRFMNRPDTLYRARMFYSKDAYTGRASIVGIGQVSTIYPKALAENEKMKTDPVNYATGWVSKTRKYVNIGFYLMTSRVESDKQRHTIGIVPESTETLTDGTTVAHLTLYHDQGGVPDYYSEEYYISIPSSAIDADSVRIKVNTNEGLKVMGLKL